MRHEIALKMLTIDRVPNGYEVKIFKDRDSGQMLSRCTVDEYHFTPLITAFSKIMVQLKIHASYIISVQAQLRRYRDLRTIVIWRVPEGYSVDIFKEWDGNNEYELLSSSTIKRGHKTTTMQVLSDICTPLGVEAELVSMEIEIEG